MSEPIIYEDKEDTILIWRTDLIEVIRECMIDNTLSISMREEYGKVIDRMGEFSDYSSSVWLLKPESKMSVDRFCEIYSGIVIVSGNRSIFHYHDVYGKQVIFYLPKYMLNSILRRIINRPKVIAISTSSILNTNHWLDSCIREKFKEADNDWFSKELREKIDAAVERAKHDDSVDVLRYCMNDVLITQEFYKQMEETMRPGLRIKNVIFHDPATIVLWEDGTKTVVKAQEGDKFDPEKGLAMAVCKKVLGSNDSQSNFNDIFKKWLPKEEKKEPEVIGEIKNMTMTDKGFVVEAQITDAEFSPRINEILGILGE